MGSGRERWRARLAAGVTAVLMLVLLPRARADEVKDRWYIVEMFGGKAGWMNMRTVTGETTVTTSATTVVALKRGAIQMDETRESEFVETREGRPVSMKSVKKRGGPAVTQEYVFKDEGIEMTTRQNGAEPRTTLLPRPEGAWLTPAAAEKYLLQRFKAGAKEITVRTMNPNTGAKVLTQTRMIEEGAKLAVLGREIDATKTTVMLSEMPGVTTVEYIDSDGELVKSRTMLGGIAVIITVATKEEAKAEGAGVVPEVLIATFIKPDRAISGARAARKAVYVLSVPEKPAPDLPETGSQRVAKVGERAVTVTVDAGHPRPAPAADEKDGKYLAASSMIDATDPTIRELAAKATARAGQDKRERAEAIRRFVYSFIRKKSLDVGFASATEVARNPVGDCTEHAVLTAALLRAQGIPARVATGLIYADEFEGGKGIFAYHMWTQALLTVDEHASWVDLDGTLPPKIPFDATHIALAVTDLGEGDAVTSMVPILTVVGRLAIKVESVEHRE